jgi:hypothetical protein
MNEKFQDTTTRASKELSTASYQSAVTELLYNVLSLANPNGSIMQPTIEEGQQTIELIPRSPDLDSLGIIVHEEGDIEPGNGELQASIQLVQGFHDANYILDSAQLEYVTEFRIFFLKGQYNVMRRNFLHDTANLSEAAIHIFDNEQPTSHRDLIQLNTMISQSSVRPAGF